MGTGSNNGQARPAPTPPVGGRPLIVPDWVQELLHLGRHLLADRRQQDEIQVRERHRLATQRWRALWDHAHANLGELAPFANWTPPPGWSLHHDRHDFLVTLPQIGRLAASYQWRDDLWHRWSYRQLEDDLTAIWGVPRYSRVLVGEDWQVHHGGFTPGVWQTAQSLPEALALAEEENLHRVTLLDECQRDNALALHHTAGRRQALESTRDVVQSWVSVA